MVSWQDPCGYRCLGPLMHCARHLTTAPQFLLRMDRAQGSRLAYPVKLMSLPILDRDLELVAVSSLQSRCKPPVLDAQFDPPGPPAPGVPPGPPLVSLPPDPPGQRKDGASILPVSQIPWRRVATPGEAREERWEGRRQKEPRRQGSGSSDLGFFETHPWRIPVHPVLRQVATGGARVSGHSQHMSGVLERLALVLNLS